MTLNKVFASKGVNRPVDFACGVAFTIYQYESVPMVVTHAEGYTVDFSTESMFHGKRVTIFGQIKTLLEPMGFSVKMAPKAIRCTYDPKGDGL